MSVEIGEYMAIQGGGDFTGAGILLRRAFYGGPSIPYCRLTCYLELSTDFIGAFYILMPIINICICMHSQLIQGNGCRLPLWHPKIFQGRYSGFETALCKTMMPAYLPGHFIWGRSVHTSYSMCCIIGLLLNNKDEKTKSDIYSQSIFLYYVTTTLISNLIPAIYIYTDLQLYLPLLNHQAGQYRQWMHRRELKG